MYHFFIIASCITGALTIGESKPAMPLIAVRNAARPDSTNLQAYTGVYKFKDNAMVEQVTVKIEKGELVAYDQNAVAYILVPDSEKADYFTVPSVSGELVFRRDENKKVVALKVMIQGTEAVAEKQP